MPPQPADLDALGRGYRLDAAQRAAVARAYRVFRTLHGPFIVAIAADLLPDLHTDVATHPGARIVFLGRLAVPCDPAEPAVTSAHTRTTAVELRSMAERARSTKAVVEDSRAGGVAAGGGDIRPADVRRAVEVKLACRWCGIRGE